MYVGLCIVWEHRGVDWLVGGYLLCALRERGVGQQLTRTANRFHLGHRKTLPGRRSTYLSSGSWVTRRLRTGMKPYDALAVGPELEMCRWQNIAVLEIILNISHRQQSHSILV